MWKDKENKESKQKCEHMDFWSIYKIINFKRHSMKWTCSLCGKDIKLKYLGHDALSKNWWVAAFSCILWMSPAFLIIALAYMYGETSGYIMAIWAVIVFHFWAMYYMVKWGLIEVKVDKK